MMVARLGDIERSPHAGLLVHGGTISCECALAVVAARERSKGNNFGTGLRVLTKNVVDCDPWLTVEEGGSTFGGQLASIEDQQDYDRLVRLLPNDQTPNQIGTVTGNEKNMLGMQEGSNMHAKSMLKAC